MHMRGRIQRDSGAAMTMDSENQMLSQTYTQIHTYTHTRAAKTNEKAVPRSRGTAKRTQTQIHTPTLTYAQMPPKLTR